MDFAEWCFLVIAGMGFGLIALAAFIQGKASHSQKDQPQPQTNSVSLGTTTSFIAAKYSILAKEQLTIPARR
jgi:hypothetical protein